MRNYKERLRELRDGISQDRLRYLQAYCRTTNSERLQVVEDVLTEEFGEDRIADWIYRDVVKGHRWAKLEADHIPCSMDAFRIYRARFYKALHIKIGGNLELHKKTPGGHHGK